MTTTAALALALVMPGSDAASAAAPAGETGAESAAPDGTAATPATETFETLAQTATPAGDIATLLGPLVDSCTEGGRDLDRARCRASQAYLRRALPERSFVLVTGDPAAIAVSAYDQTIKGYRLALAACIACSNPIPVGRAAQPLLVTLKKPVEGASEDDKHAGKRGDRGGGAAAASVAGEPLPAAVEVATTTMGFASEAEAVRWLREVRPRLRATFVLRPAPSEWRFRSMRGYALPMIAGRVVDPCTGDVVLSSPPSTGMGERVISVACPRVERPPAAPDEPATASPSDDEEEQLPGELSRSAISQSMGQIRSQVFACFQRYQVPGTAQLTYEVAGNGQVQAVRLEGPLGGTPTGACVLDAARGARFPRFDGPIQTFNYPFFLRR